MLAYDYPLLSVFWSIFVFYLFFIWIIALFHVFGDIFRSKDLGGFAKAMWLIFVIILPFLGVLIYVVARGDKMAQHAMESAQAQDAAMRAYVQESAGVGGTAAELEKLASLRDAGTITPAEFEAGKAKILA
jgi:ABC-type multidrug transport system fused ATPase/permease subunit